MKPNEEVKQNAQYKKQCITHSWRLKASVELEQKFKGKQQGANSMGGVEEPQNHLC